MTSSSQPRRREIYLDRVRGLAVIAMFIWHTADAWIDRDALPSPYVWRVLRLVGGLAAPGFFVMIGATLALRVSALRGDGLAPGSMCRVLIARGIELLVYGYLLQLQFWITSGAPFRSAPGVAAAVLLLAGYLLSLLGLRQLGQARARAASWQLGLAGALLAGGTVALYRAGGAHVVADVLQVDVLNALGLAMIVTALVVVWVPGALAAHHGWLFALAVTLPARPLARAFDHRPPPSLSHYLVRLPEAVRGSAPQARFPLIPWLGLSLGGVTLRSTIAASPDRKATALWLSLAAAALTVLSYERLFYVRALRAALPVTTQPLRMLFRFSAVACACGLAVRLARPTRERPGIIDTCGRTSLLLYWVHLPLAYGTLSSPAHRALTLWQWAIGVTLLAAAMYGLGRARLWQRRSSRAR